LLPEAKQHNVNLASKNNHMLFDYGTYVVTLKEHPNGSDSIKISVGCAKAIFSPVQSLSSELMRRRLFCSNYGVPEKRTKLCLAQSVKTIGIVHKNFEAFDQRDL
jgi:hypothetical protein